MFACTPTSFSSFRLVLLLALVGSAAGTHFRYGVIRWWVGPDSLSSHPAQPVYQAVFEVKGAWRRDYSWGALFNEEWRSTPSDSWKQAPVANGDFDCSAVSEHDPVTTGIQCFEEGNEEYSNYQIKFRTGLGFQGLELPSRSNRQCTSPLHKGMVGDLELGTYGGPGPTLGTLDRALEEGFWGVEDVEDKTTSGADDDRNSDLGALLPASDISVSGVCAPWAETFGFFFGDGTSAEEVVVTVTDIDFDRGLVGNVIRATSDRIVHNYTTPVDDSIQGSPKPWVAYWTGGNRLSQLRNNPDGRFRLEVDVRFLTRCTPGSGCSVISNSSPVVAQIPVMPVVYPSSGVAMFQVAAYDPDYLSNQDQVRFFVGNQQEHGYILANYIRYRETAGGPVKEDPTYYPDVYHRVMCERQVGNASVCTEKDLVGPNKAVIFGDDYAGDPELTAEGTPNSTLYYAWDPRVNIAHAPYGRNGDVLSIGSRNGMVTWDVGTSPTDGLAPGFYQLTVMVEERLSHDYWLQLDRDTAFRLDYSVTDADYFAGYNVTSGDDMVGTGDNFAPADTGTSRRGGPRVPLDFMLYLYPAMHYCSKNCDRTNNIGNIMQTFESVDGLYGDPPGGPRPGDGLVGGGSGSCKICGGGGSYTNVPGDSGMVYDDAVKDSLSYCRVLPGGTAEVKQAYTRGYNVTDADEEIGLWGNIMSEQAFKDYNDTCAITSTTTFNSGLECLESELCNTEWTFQGCLGFTQQGSDSIIPYDGFLDACQINNPPRFITECDCDGQTWLTSTGSNPVFTPSAQGCLYNAKADGTGIERATFTDCCDNPITPLDDDSPSTAEYAGMFRTGTVRGVLGVDLFFDLVATDDDQCVELVIGDTGLPSSYMTLEPHQRLDPNTVSRRFTFNPPPETNGSATADPRETFTKVCFYVTDKYLMTSYPYHCLHIELVPPVAAKWCDEVASNGQPAPDGTPGTTTNTLEEYAVLQAYAGEEVALPLCVYKSETSNVEHRMQIQAVTEGVPADYPNMYNFSYPHDAINFPPYRGAEPQRASIAGVPDSGWAFVPTLNGTGTPLTTTDPLYQTFVFTPDATQECLYTVCFRGVDVDAADVDDPSATPTQFTSVRCYRIEVYNSVLEFGGESEVQVAGLSEAVTIADGFSMAAWVMPTCVAPGTNMTVMYFGSVRRFPARQTGLDTGLPLRNAIKWAETREDGLGRFYYEDWRVGIKASPESYACDAWHFVAFTVTEGHSAVLYVDGSTAQSDGPASAHTRVTTQLNFTTPSRPDTPDDVTVGTGRFALGSHQGGQPLVGQLDDVYVWNRALNASEVGTVMSSRTLFAEDAIQDALLVWFPMRDGAGGGDLPLADYALSGPTPYTLASTGTTPPVVVNAATPAVVPCVLGLQMPVGPTDGLCMQSVYGWNFARGPFLAARFGDITVPATYVNDTEMLVETPGHVSPRFVSVTASNDGKSFTDEVGVGRLTEFLYMDAGLYMDGEDGGGLADSVCPDLPNRNVTFGAWVCVDCGQPVVHYDAPHPGQPNPEPEGRPEEPRDEVLRPLRDLGVGGPNLYE